jgi:hypothetical protein
MLIAPIWTIASGVPMDILMPDAQSRVPVFQRNAGGRLFKTAAELNRAISEINAADGINGQLLPLVSDDAKFSDSFNAFDLRVSRPFQLRRVRVEPILEVFTVNRVKLNNILGVSLRNYSGYSNVWFAKRQNPERRVPAFLFFGQP